MIDDADYQRTFALLQRMEPGPFHQLGDDLLPEFSSDFTGLKPHGLNREGKSKPGVPDSFVGASAQTCLVAVEYTTRATDLESKLRSDYEAIRTHCPKARVVYLCTNREFDDSRLSDLIQNSAASGIQLQVINGHRIARWLVDKRQDLRHRHLRIPIAALTIKSLLCQLHSQLERFLKMHIDRDALGTLFSRPNAERDLADRIQKPGQSVLSAPAGAGKTTWSFEQARRRGTLSPSIWIPATELSLGATDPICEMITHAAYGVAAHERTIELARILERTETPLFVCIDGIDEVSDYQAFARAARIFRSSSLSSFTHILFTCREDALPVLIIGGMRVRTVAHDREDDRDSSSMLIRLDELKHQDVGEFLSRLGATPLEAHQVLRSVSPVHKTSPLFLKHGLKLAKLRENTGPLDLIDTISKSYVREVASRLRINGRGPSAAKVLASLSRLALLVARSARDAVALAELGQLHDDLLDLDGESSLIGRATQAGLLRTSGDELRFEHSAFVDWFAAEGLVSAVDWMDRARQLPQPRLRRILPMLAGRIYDPARLLDMAAEIDLAMSCTLASMMWCDLNSEQQTRILSRSQGLLASRYAYDRRRAIDALSRLKVPAAGELLLSWLCSLSDSDQESWAVEASHALIRLEVSAATRIVLLNVHFVMARDGWFEPAFVTELQSLAPSFLRALADQAWRDLEEAADETIYLQRVAALAMLKDTRLIEYLEQHLADRDPKYVEVWSLVFLDTERSIKLFGEVCERTLEKLAQMASGPAGSTSLEISALKDTISPTWNCVSMFPYERLISFLQDRLSVQDEIKLRFWLEWAASVGDSRLAVVYANAAYREPIADRVWKGRSGGLVSRMRVQDVVDMFPSGSPALRRAIVLAARAFAGPDIEQLLMDALDDGDLRHQAIFALGRIGAMRVGPKLIEYLKGDDGLLRWHVLEALGRLRYTAAIPALEALLHRLQEVPREDRPPKAVHSEYEVVRALGNVGGPEACAALERWFPYSAEPGEVLGRLLRWSEDSGVRACERLLREDVSVHRFLVDGLTYRELEGSHPKPDLPAIESDYLLSILLEQCRNAPTVASSFERSHVTALARFSSASAIRRLEEIAAQEVSDPQPMEFDLVARARRVLARRGHEVYTPLIVQEEVADAVQSPLPSRWDQENLERWPQGAVRSALLAHVTRRQQAGSALMLLYALSRTPDRQLLEALSQDEDQELANIAYQLLHDPNPLAWM